MGNSEGPWSCGPSEQAAGRTSVAWAGRFAGASTGGMKARSWGGEQAGKGKDAKDTWLHIFRFCGPGEQAAGRASVAWAVKEACAGTSGMIAWNRDGVQVGRGQCARGEATCFSVDPRLKWAGAGSERARYKLAGCLGQARSGCGRGAGAMQGRHAGRGRKGGKAGLLIHKHDHFTRQRGESIDTLYELVRARTSRTVQCSPPFSFRSFRF